MRRRELGSENPDTILHLATPQPTISEVAHTTCAEGQTYSLEVAI